MLLGRTLICCTIIDVKFDKVSAKRREHLLIVCLVFACYYKS